MSFNSVTLRGNLTKDPEMKGQENNVCVTGIATNRRFRKANGEQGEEVMFVDIVAFGKTGEALHQYNRKGDPILIHGRLMQDRWEDNNGNNRSKHKVAVESMDFLNKLNKGDGGGGQQQGGGAPAPPDSWSNANDPANEDGDIPF